MEISFDTIKHSTARLKTAVRNYIYGNGESIILADYNLNFDWLLSEGQPDALISQIEALDEAGESLLERATQLISLYQDGNLDEARSALEVFSLKADNLLLQLQLMEMKLGNGNQTLDLEESKSNHFEELEQGIQDINLLYQDHSDSKETREALRKSEEKFRLLSASIPQFIWTVGHNGQLDYFNESLVKYSGYSDEELRQGHFPELVHPDDREENRVRWENSVETGNEFLIEHRLRRHDGEYRWYLCRALAQKDSDGRILQWVGTSTDIHEQKTFQKTLETLVEERTNDLKKANLELEHMNRELSSFAYVSSHDLQEPLRKIQTFGSIIMSHEYQNLSEAGKNNFNRMQLAASRMTKLIQDLLTYSRTNTVENAYEQTDLNTLLTEIASDFEEALEEKGGTLTISPMPVITGIPFQLRQLFNNLVSNALKFSKEDVAPAITITSGNIKGNSIDNQNANPEIDYLHIAVADNGIGFSPEYASRIFEVFQRLHGKTEYEGTGIGLAICMKIAENHKAVINASSQPGEGAVFNIYFPLN